ncbi:hypothetical protein [Flaviaesturariibacter amylovorans]|uniref:Uncharacterized protein n=1 Tax=Flaviaesturariibacter amylovorans TaxID=1084520 RepID=A0ABP8HDU2_9BACT
MDSRPPFLTDPYGLHVFGLEAHCGDTGVSEGRYNEFRSAVERPALIIRYAEPPRRYYLRSLGWDFSVLLEAAPEHDHWVVRACTFNPADAYLQGLIRGGELLSEGDYNL